MTDPRPTSLPALGICLEEYPAQSEETLYEHEVNWTDPSVIRAYVDGYFGHPDPKVCEPLAEVLIRVTLSSDYPRWARAAARTFQMIY
jgi:hypothetical protein